MVKEEMKDVVRIALDQGWTTARIRDYFVKRVREKRWRDSEKAMQIAEFDRTIAEAVKERHPHS